MVIRDDPLQPPDDEVLRAEPDEHVHLGFADEIQHVRFGNDWLRRLVADDPRAVLKVAAGVDFVRRVQRNAGAADGDLSVDGKPLAGVRHPVATSAADRRELDEILRQEREQR